MCLHEFEEKNGYVICVPKKEHCQKLLPGLGSLREALVMQGLRLEVYTRPLLTAQCLTQK